MTLKAAFETQATACAQLGSPFMAQLFALLAHRLRPDTTVTKRLFDWPGDINPSGDSVPLRLAGGFHALALMHPSSDIAAAYPPNKADDETLWRAIQQTLTDHQDFLMNWLNSPPQTNEVRRSAALIPAARWLTRKFDLPLTVSELGASAGLNLMFDRFALNVAGQVFGPKTPALTLHPNWTGPNPATGEIKISDRRGVDLNPLSPADPADQLRLRAYLWPDQPERRALTDAAIACAQGIVDKGSAETWLPARLGAHTQGTCHMIYHTIAWQYFPEDIQTKCRAMIETAGAKTSDPLAWFAMEADGGTGAALTLRLWPGDLQFQMGHADFHGRWIDWSPPN